MKFSRQPVSSPARQAADCRTGLALKYKNLQTSNINRKSDSLNADKVLNDGVMLVPE